MSLTGRRRQSAADKARHRIQRAAQQRITERPCAMPKCSRLTARPLGYCDSCWDNARRAEQ